MDRVVNAAATVRRAGQKAVVSKAHPPDSKWSGHNVNRDRSVLTATRALTGRVPPHVLIDRTGRNVQMANVLTDLKPDGLTVPKETGPTVLTVTGPMQAVRIVRTDRITTVLNVLIITARTGLRPVVLTGTTVPTDPIAGVQIAPIDQTGTGRIDRTGPIKTVRTGTARTAPMQDVLTGRAIPHDRIIARTGRTGTEIGTIATSTTAGTVTSGVVIGTAATTVTGGVMITASVAGPV